MAVKKRKLGKIVGKYEFFDIRVVEKYEGHGVKKKLTGSSLGVYHAKTLLKDGFKNTQEALQFAIAITPTYEKKGRKYKETKN